MLTPDGPKIDKGLLSKKADELDKKIKELTIMRNDLRHAAHQAILSALSFYVFLNLQGNVKW